MKTSLLVFPHQLFRHHQGLLRDPDEILLIEDALFFGDTRYPVSFHKQKLWLHRASMKRYEQWLRGLGRNVLYIEYEPGRQTLADALNRCAERGVRNVIATDPTDFILAKRLERWTRQRELRLELLDNPGFLNTPVQNRDYRAARKRWFMADFYQYQRRWMDILMDGDEPEGGRWSFDEENRKKVPKRLLGQIPPDPTVNHDQLDQEARLHVEKHFSDHPGNLEQLRYPTSHEAATEWLQTFLRDRFSNFGDYEDAIVEGESWLWHSVLTPALNIGLLTPEQVVQEALEYAREHDVPLNSLEGFLRQIIGWREFMRATYEDLGVKMRTTNYWQHHRTIPDSFYDGSTGIDPVDDVIGRINATGYCHHIERLMVLGGFMFLCEFDPDEIYRWFMEMFVDSYDWVMVPNVYAMSQNADGGQITTKPYFSGSSYIRKMSHYKKGDWCDIWDGLYWRWIWNHRDELGKNPRWAMMCRMAERMDSAKRTRHLRNAESFLKQLDQPGEGKTGPSSATSASRLF